MDTRSSTASPIDQWLGKVVASRTITVLGSTGSVGRNTLDLVMRARQAIGSEAFPVQALTAQKNVDLLVRQACTIRPKSAVIGDPSLFGKLKEGLDGTGVEAAAGGAALVEAADRPAEWVMAAIVGAAGLPSALRAVERGASVALANKECLVCAGSLFMRTVEETGATLLPVDSEHNAIFQVFDYDRPETVEGLILTASGGPFRTSSLEEMAAATPEQAMAHPNWSMGAKISVDSATMMNKGLELIEASYLFPVDPERIEILFHPQSIVHSLVRYIDGSVLAQLGTPDMRIPIASALAWPDRIPTPSDRLDLGTVETLSFESPDYHRFPALSLARQSLQSGGGAPTILNAANEVAVRGFLDRQVGFLDIAAIVEKTLEELSPRVEEAHLNDFEDVTNLDARARTEAKRHVDDIADTTRRL